MELTILSWFMVWGITVKRYMEMTIFLRFREFVKRHMELTIFVRFRAKLAKFRVWDSN